MNSTTVFFLLIPILGLLLLAINFLFATHSPYLEKNSVFECGFHSFLGQNRMQFNISFYIFGLLFLLFDLEILLIYPYPVSSYFNSLYSLCIMLIFFLVLTGGFTFELGKNALKIDSRQYEVKNVVYKPKYILESNIFGRIYAWICRTWSLLLVSLLVLLGITGLPRILVINFFYSNYILAIIAGIGAIFISIIHNIKNKDFKKNNAKYLSICFFKAFIFCIILLIVIYPCIKYLILKYTPIYLSSLLYYAKAFIAFMSSLFEIFPSSKLYHVVGDNIPDEDITISNIKEIKRDTSKENIKKFIPNSNYSHNSNSPDNTIDPKCLSNENNRSNTCHVPERPYTPESLKPIKTSIEKWESMKSNENNTSESNNMPKKNNTSESNNMPKKNNSSGANKKSEFVYSDKVPILSFEIKVDFANGTCSSRHTVIKNDVPTWVNGGDWIKTSSDTTGVNPNTGAINSKNQTSTNKTLPKSGNNSGGSSAS